MPHPHPYAVILRAVGVDEFDASSLNRSADLPDYFVARSEQAFAWLDALDCGARYPGGLGKIVLRPTQKGARCSDL